MDYLVGVFLYDQMIKMIKKLINYIHNIRINILFNKKYTELRRMIYWDYRLF